MQHGKELRIVRRYMAGLDAFHQPVAFHRHRTFAILLHQMAKLLHMECRRCGQHENLPTMAQKMRRLERRFHADDRDIELCAQFLGCRGCRRVAGKDERLDVALQQGLNRTLRAIQNFTLSFDAVRGVLIVSVKDKALMGQHAHCVAQHADPTHAGIKHTDGPGHFHPPKITSIAFIISHSFAFVTQK